MFYVILGAGVVIVLAQVANIVLGRVIRNLEREHARRQDLLLNQLLHATGKTWQPPPAEPREMVPDRVPSEWTTSPEQEPK